MATRAKVTLTYSDLKDLAINHILGMCRNISGRSDIPSTMRKGYVKQFRLTTGGSDSGGANFNLSDDTAVYDVTEQAIRIKFEQFMITCGISGKNTLIPTTRGLINFWNNVSSFCATYIRIATSCFPQDNPDQRLIFDDRTTSVVKYTVLNKEEEVITADDINESFEYIKNIGSNINAVKAMVYNIQSFCSCSSSSSSSSCSSSVFIGYMKLGD